MTVANAMVKCLELEGITTVFGIPGATICPFYDALYDSKIECVLVRHEQSAGHCANGYARLANKPSVCIGTSGPGALNLLTAVATAYMDSIPMVVITGQVGSEQLGRDVFQEADITGAAEPFIKHSYLIKSAAEVQTAIKNAFHIASTGRQGPVIIDIPVDIQLETVEFFYPKEVELKGYNPNFKGHMGQTKKLIAAINTAKKPLICVGGGVFSANATAVLLKLIDKCKIPVVSTMMGISAVSPTNQLYIGMVGMYGHRGANLAVNEADLLILIGARVGDRAIMSPIGLSENTIIAHLDIDPAEIGKNIKTDIPIVGDAKDILTELLNRLHIMDKSSLAVTHKFSQEHNYTGDYIDPSMLISMLMDRLPSNAIIVADVGQNQLYSAKGYNICHGRFLTSGGMGTMGYALPASIGAGIYDKTLPIICICGDGGFQMSLPELATLAEVNATVKIVLLNNNSLGLVKELQQKQYHGREISVDFSHNPDFTKLCSAYGIGSRKVTLKSELDEALTELIHSTSSFLLECEIK